MRHTAQAALIAAGLVAPAWAHAQARPTPTVTPLTPNERLSTEIATAWMSNPTTPRRGDDGSVVYLYGATMPTLVCSPLQVCTIRLQPGEVVNDVHAGDVSRWKISPTTTGTGANLTTLLAAKPTEPGLNSNVLITTDRRVYTIRLVSTEKEWIPILAFDYPQDVEASWSAYRAETSRRETATTFQTGERITDLDFEYEISGDTPRWRPLRVYADGVRTFIQFPTTDFAGTEAPALVVRGPDGDELVNYRVIGDRYVVDQVIERAALVSGVGRKQVEVTIQHRTR
jgi:type IV secretion system protein VirB9